ncbi:MAG: hypothetical protein AAF686_08925, partial [Pseudomonadota bacterium]
MSAVLCFYLAKNGMHPHWANFEKDVPVWCALDGPPFLFHIEGTGQKRGRETNQWHFREHILASNQCDRLLYGKQSCPP